MTELDPAALADAIRETGMALRPGDVLAVRLPSGINPSELRHANDYGRAVEAETGVKVAFIPGEEFSVTTVNVTVNFTGDAKVLTNELYEAVRRQRRNGGGSLPFAG